LHIEYCLYIYDESPHVRKMGSTPTPFKLKNLHFNPGNYL
jgi:hypothetical protein